MIWGRLCGYKRTARIHVIFRWGSIVAGLSAAGYAYAATRSIALPVFAFVVLARFGPYLDRVVTDKKRVRRALYYLLAPASATTVLHWTYQRYGQMWLAVISGLVVGLLAWAVLVQLLFPVIRKEEVWK